MKEQLEKIGLNIHSYQQFLSIFHRIAEDANNPERNPNPQLPLYCLTLLEGDLLFNILFC